MRGAAMVNETAGLRRTVNVICCVFCLCIGLSGKSHGIEWTSECVDRSRMLEGLSGKQFAMDSQGILHVVYGGFRLYHAYRDSMDCWHEEIVDMATSVGKQPSLVIEGNDRLHVAYLDENNNTVKYAYLCNAGWFVEEVEGSSGLGDYCSLDIDDSSQPRIVCWGEEKNRLVQFSRNGSQWEEDQVCVPTGDLFQLQLKIDSDGFSHLCICSLPDNEILYFQQIGSEWSNVVLGFGWSPSIDLDNENQPHIAFWDSDADAIVYHHRASEEWIAEQVMDSDGGLVSLQLDAEQQPHVVTGSYMIHYARREADTWHIETVKGPEDMRYYDKGLSLVLGSSSDPHFCYVVSCFYPDWHHTWLEYTWKQDESWLYETIKGQSSDVGQSPTIAIGPNGEKHIAYYSSELTYAFDDGNDWFIERVPGQGGHRVKLTVDSNNHSHLVFRDADSILKYAYSGESHWEFETVDDGPSGIPIFSVAIDDEDFIHVAYNRDGLRYAIRDEESWDIALLDSSDLIPYDIALRDELVYIGFKDSSSDSVGYGWWDGNQWVMECADGSDQSDVYLAVDSNNNPHLSYRYAWDTLRYATKRNDTWIFETVDDNPQYPYWIGNANSIVLDSDGSPIISYHHYYLGPWGLPSFRGFIAAKSDSGWYLDDTPSGTASELVIDLSGTVHIAAQRPNYANSSLWYYSATPPLASRIRLHGMNPVVLKVDGTMPVKDELRMSVSLPVCMDVDISLFNLSGQKVGCLHKGRLESGSHTLGWNSRRLDGISVPSGTYILNANAKQWRVSERIVIIR